MKHATKQAITNQPRRLSERPIDRSAGVLLRPKLGHPLHSSIREPKVQHIGQLNGTGRIGGGNRIHHGIGRHFTI